MRSTRRVLITGLGVVSPIGCSRESFWDSLISGRGGVREIPELSKAGLATGFGGLVEGFEGKDFVTPRKSLKVMAPETQWAYAAAKMAMADAGIAPGSLDSERFGVVYGADMIYTDARDLIDGAGNCLVDGRFDVGRWGAHALPSIYPLWLLKNLPNMPACHIGIAHDARGPNNTIVSGEVSSLVAMSEALRLIERGAVDVVITGGVSNGLNFLSWPFRDARHSRRREDPAGACRPFDADRDGMVCGQGAAALVFESQTHAEARRARVLARVLSAEHAFDAAVLKDGNLSDGVLDDAVPNAAESGTARVIRRALRQGALPASRLGFITAHGYGTRQHDRREARAILAAAPAAPVTALKGYLGCLQAACGAVETVAAILSLEHGRVPLALNSRRPDPECGLNLVRDEPAPLTAPTALILSQSTMGQTAALLLAGPEF